MDCTKRAKWALTTTVHSLRATNLHQKKKQTPNNTQKTTNLRKPASCRTI